MMLLTALLTSVVVATPDTKPDLACAVTIIRAGWAETGQKDADKEMVRMAIAHFFFGRLSALDPSKSWPEVALNEARKISPDREALLKNEMMCMGRQAGLMLGKALPD